MDYFPFRSPTSSPLRTEIPNTSLPTGVRSAKSIIGCTRPDQSARWVTPAWPEHSLFQDRL